MENILITGAAGFIGSHVCDYLNSKNVYNIVALDDLSGGFKDNIDPEITFVQGSITDKDIIEKLFNKYRFKYVFHLAAYAAEGLSHFIRKFNYENNLIGSVNLVNASIKFNCVECFVFTSSIAVYGANQLPMKEETTPLPEDPYGIAKYAIEMDLKSAKEMFGLDYIIFRPHNVYGSRQNLGDPYRNVVGIFMNQIMQNKPLSIFGDGKQTRAFSHIFDVAPIMGEAIFRKEAYNQVFNIGADQPYSVLQLAEIVCKEFNVEGKINFLEARNEVMHAYSTHEKIKSIFSDLINDVSLEDGIKEMADWAKKSGSRKGEKFNNIEVERNLPPFWTNL